jgi:hypothetical protein
MSSECRPTRFRVTFVGVVPTSVGTPGRAVLDVDYVLVAHNVMSQQEMIELLKAQKKIGLRGTPRNWQDRVTSGSNVKPWKESMEAESAGLDAHLHPNKFYGPRPFAAKEIPQILKPDSADHFCALSKPKKAKNPVLEPFEHVKKPPRSKLLRTHADEAKELSPKNVTFSTSAVKEGPNNDEETLCPDHTASLPSSALSATTGNISAITNRELTSSSDNSPTIPVVSSSVSTYRPVTLTEAIMDMHAAKPREGDPKEDEDNFEEVED